MKLLFLFLKHVFFAFVLAPITYSSIVGTLQLLIRPQVQDINYSGALIDKFDFGNNLILIFFYYSYLILIGSLILTALNKMKSETKEEKTTNIKWPFVFVYFLVFQLVALTVSNLISDLFHFGHTTIKLSIFLPLTSAVFTYAYSLLFKNNRT